MVKTQFSSDQIFTLILVSCGNLICSTCISLQAPFYPAEAEKKGATATEYGLVFGSYELVSFLTSPLFGKIINKTGSKFMFGGGMLVSSVAIFLFGFLHLITDRFNFIFWSFVARIVEALGASAVAVAIFSVIGCMFPDNVATVMSTLETFYGVGFIIGPIIGGVLYEVGGFPFPFFVVGIAGGITSILVMTYIPNVSGTSKTEPHNDNIYNVIKIPSVAINMVCTATFSLSQSFFSSTLEPHLRIFQISAMLVSMMFVINGATYAVASPIIGRLVDKCLKPKHVLIVSLIFDLICFSILGPLPFLPIPQTLTVCIIALFFQGLALAGGFVATFTDSIKSAVEAGYPADISTYGMISGIWFSSLSLGAFIGPSAGGILSDLVGFQYSTIFVVVVIVILLFVVSTYVISKKIKDKGTLEVEDKEIVQILGESTSSLFELNRPTEKKIYFNGYEVL